MGKHFRVLHKSLQRDKSRMFKGSKVYDIVERCEVLSGASTGISGVSMVPDFPPPHEFVEPSENRVEQC